MRSARGSAFSSSAPRFDYSTSNGFQMPAYTSHTSRSSPTKARNSKPQPRARSPAKDDGVEDDMSHPCSESDQNLLAMLTSTVACLKEKQMDIEALGCLEQSLWLKRRMFGIESSAVQKALHEVVLSYNSIAMQFLAMGQFDQCLSMLRKAEAITAPPGNFKNCQSLQILTFNNIGCCYRKLGKLKSALKYLKEAAQIGAGCAHVKNLSITHLNLCAIQSQLGRHDLALEHAQAAIFHTQEELVSLDSVGSDGKQGGQSSCEDVLDAKSREEKIVSLAVAYHNLAVELEFNDRGEASLQWYKKALQLVSRFKDTNQALCESFEKIFLDAKRKYQVSQQTQSQSVSAMNHQRATRPKSAHLSSSRGAVKPAVPSTTAGSRDVSYSATVASQCYKPTKPSAAGLQYSRASPGKPGARNPTAVPPQRPSSATSSRRRPLSASSSSQTTRQPSASLSRPANDRFAGGNGTQADTIEWRWKQIEQELFGNRDAVEAEDGRYLESTRPSSGSRGRPQSARHARNVSKPPSPEQSRGRGKQQIPVESQFMDEDDECGIIQDEDDDDEVEAQFQGARQPPNTKITVQRSMSARRAVDTRDPSDGKPNRNLSANGRSGSQRQPNSARHRHVLSENRQNSTPSRPSVNRTRRSDEDSEGHTSSGYVGEEEDFNSLSESSSSSDLPQQRVNHLEYLRRMKQLSDSIHEDLSGKARAPSNRPSSRQVRSREPEPVKPSITAASNASDRTSKPKRVVVASDDEEAVISTPRGSSSKLRERLELVRRDSVKSFDATEGAEDECEVSAEKECHGVPGIVVTEAVHVFPTDTDTLAAERELLHHASARRIQLAARGNAASRRFVAVRRQKEHEREVQMRAKRAIIEAKELELQAQRVARQANRGDQAARIIQDAYRRELAREMQMKSKREIIEAKERELQAQREERQVQRSEFAARIIQSTYRRHVQSRDTDEDANEEDIPPTAEHDPADWEAVAGDRDVPVPEGEREHQDDEEESHYTPLASYRSSMSHHATETSTNSSQLGSARSAVAGERSEPALLSPREAVSPRDLTLPPSSSSSRSQTPRSSVQSATPRDSVGSPQASSRNNLDEEHASALHIQCAFRKQRASHRVALRHARRMSRSYIERNHMKVVLTQAEAKELAFLEELSAIKIQAVARGRQARFLFEAERIGRHAAASTIQTNFRRHQHHVQRSATRGVESIAARNIQRKYRAYASRQARRQQLEMYEEALEVHHIAAQTVQRRWRHWSQQREHKVEEWEAATCIQALGRGHLARKSYQSLKASASRSSAFSIDNDGGMGGATTSRSSSREHISEDADDMYEEAFDDDNDSVKQPSPVVSSGRSTNLSFLPIGVRDLFVRYASSPHALPTNSATTSASVVDEMLNAGYGLDEMTQELETCPDADSAVTLLDAMTALVELHSDQFRTLPHLVRAANALEKRIQNSESWDLAVEARAAAFMLLFHDLLTE